jgi:hypothetical protein
MSIKLSIAEVQKFENYITRTYDGVVFELMVTHNLLVESAIELIWIIGQDRKLGVGTSIMRELCEFADRHKAEIRCHNLACQADPILQKIWFHDRQARSRRGHWRSDLGPKACHLKSTYSVSLIQQCFELIRPARRPRG